MLLQGVAPPVQAPKNPHHQKRKRQPHGDISYVSEEGLERTTAVLNGGMMTLSDEKDDPFG